MTTPALAGRLLVSTPALRDPNFLHAVVLVLDHDEEGSLGVVINRPTELRITDVLPPWSGLAATPDVVFQGGPVSLDSALGLAAVDSVDGEDEEPLGFRRVTGPLGLIDLDAPPELLAAELRGLRIFAGYAGWGPGQLESELEQGAWYVVEAEPGDAFSPAPHDLWRSVLRRQRGELALVATCPEDPSLN
jgi:putative transcriptional regulator